MKKEEILEKIRKENKDEYADKVFKDAQIISFIMLIAVCTLFALARVWQGESFIEFAAVLSAYSAATHFYTFNKIKNKYNLIAALLFAAAFLGLIAAYLIRYIING